MLTQATHLSSELSFVWQTAKIMRSKAHNSKQKQFIGNPQEMTALEIRLELLVAKIQPHLQVGMSMEEITRNLEEEIFQVRLLLYAEKPDITINDVEESLSAYYHQSEFVALIESIEFACRISLRFANEYPDFVRQFLLLQGIENAKDADSIVADSIEQIRLVSYRYVRYTLQENNADALAQLFDISFLLDVQLISAILVLEKEIILNPSELKFLCNAINDAAQTLGAYWRKTKRSVQLERHSNIEKEDVMFAVPFDLDLAEQGIAEYTELLAAEEGV